MPKNPDPLIISRSLKAPPRLVFEAFSTAEHVKQWFSPEGLTTPHAEVDFRPGGVFKVCMKMPDGTEHWSGGTFTEVKPYERISFSGKMGDPDNPGFSAVTTVTFKAEGGGTLLIVRQEYDIHDEAFLAAVSGAPEGWRTTLNKLERLTAQMAAPAAHDSFTLERTLDAQPGQVFPAFTTKAAKAKWFRGPPGWTTVEEVFDVRPGGRERAVTRSTEGVAHIFDAVYFEATPDRRIVYAYEMHIDQRRISVSLATVELTAQGSGTRLKITEQGVFLNGYEDGGSRLQGTNQLMDQLAASLER